MASKRAILNKAGEPIGVETEYAESEREPDYDDDKQDNPEIYDDDENTEIIVPKKFRDKRTGKIVTQFNIFDIKYMEEVKDKKKLKKVS